MIATLDERIPLASTSVSDVTRVAIREVREATFRALVAAGASSAEARLAAEQVLFTELHRGRGLVALLDDLRVGPWVQTGLACEREPLGERWVLRVTGSVGSGALRQGGLLVDLLSVEPEPTVVVSDGLDALSSLLDEPLIRAARSTGSFFVAADTSASSLDFRVAAPDGAIGVSVAGTAPSPDPDLVSVVPGVSLSRLTTVPGAAIGWITAAEQAAARAEAAQQGLLVDTAVWREVTTAASGYLVPEQ